MSFSKPLAMYTYQLGGDPQVFRLPGLDIQAENCSEEEILDQVKSLASINGAAEILGSLQFLPDSFEIELSIDDLSLAGKTV